MQSSMNAFPNVNEHLIYSSKQFEQQMRCFLFMNVTDNGTEVWTLAIGMIVIL